MLPGSRSRPPGSPFWGKRSHAAFFLLPESKRIGKPVRSFHPENRKKRVRLHAPPKQARLFSLRPSLKVNQPQADLQRFVHLLHQLVVQMGDLVRQPLLVDGADLLQQNHRILL